MGIETPEQIDNHAQVEFFSGVLIPGLINAHTHLELSYLAGKIPRGTGFAGFADGIARCRHQVPEEDRIAAAAFRMAKIEQEGVVAVGDICNNAFAFEAKTRSRLSFLNFIEYFGLASRHFPATDAVAERSRTMGFRTSQTPHSTYSLNDLPFRQIAREGNPLSIHFMESRAEAELFAHRGALYDRNHRLGVEVDFTGYGSPARRLVASIPPEKDLLLIHNTFVEDEDIQRIEAHFTGKVTWVLCPRSNEFIEGVLPPYERLQRHGVRIALGTDSMASNDDLSLLEELKRFSGKVPLHTLIRWATLGGAEALGIEAWAGSFEIGKRPGAVLLSGADPLTETLRPEATTRSLLSHPASGRA